MNLLHGDNDHRSNNHYQDCRVINGISLGLAVVKGRKKFHESMSHKPRYKTALPFLEMRFLQNGWSTHISKFGNEILMERQELKC